MGSMGTVERMQPELWRGTECESSNLSEWKQLRWVLSAVYVLQYGGVPHCGGVVRLVHLGGVLTDLCRWHPAEVTRLCGPHNQPQTQ